MNIEKHSQTIELMMEKNFSNQSIVIELMHYAEEQKRTASTELEREYWQGRADALRIVVTLIAEDDTNRLLATCGVTTSKNKYSPDLDVEIAHNVLMKTGTV